MRSRTGALTISNSGDMSQATLTSTALFCAHIDQVQIQIAWTGTSPVGAVKLQASADDAWPPEAGAPTNWDDITGASFSVSGNSGTTTITLSPCPYRWVRLVYTKTSGTGTLSARFQEKGSQ